MSHAIVPVEGDVITGITVTSWGYGYTSAPMVTFGGGSIPSADRFYQPYHEPLKNMLPPPPWLMRDNHMSLLFAATVVLVYAVALGAWLLQ